MESAYKISKFNLEEDLYKDNGFFVIVVGKSRSGKGCYSHNLLEKMIKNKLLKVKNAYLFSSSADVQPDSFSCIKHNRYTQYDDKFVLKIVEDNGNIIKHQISKGKTKKQAIEDNGLLFIVDDLASGDIHRSKSLLLLATAGRHKACNVILLTQALASAVNTRVRKNASMIVAYPSISHKVMELLIREYGLMSLGGMSFKEARQFLMNLWQSKPYTALCILQHKTDIRRFEDMIRFDRVSTDPVKTIKYLNKKTLDKKHNKPNDNVKSIFRKKNKRYT